jgi:hypothetical protein
VTTTNVSIEAHISKLQSRIAKRRKANQDDLELIVRLESKLHRSSVVEKLNVPDGVRTRYRNRCRDKRLDEAMGTVTNVRRTRATVCFGSLGKWNFPIGDLIPVEKQQGIAL